MSARGFRRFVPARMHAKVIGVTGPSSLAGHESWLTVAHRP